MFLFELNGDTSGGVSHPSGTGGGGNIYDVFKQVFTWIWDTLQYKFTDGTLTFSLLDVIVVVMSASLLGYILATLLYKFVTYFLD